MMVVQYQLLLANSDLRLFWSKQLTNIIQRYPMSFGSIFNGFESVCDQLEHFLFSFLRSLDMFFKNTGFVNYGIY